MKIRAVSVLFAAVLFSSALNAQVDSARSKQVTLTGTVQDGDGRLLSAVEVFVDDNHRTISDAKGEFTIPGLSAGVIDFTARRIGYQPVVSAVQADAGLIVHLAVKLVPVATVLGTVVIEGKTLDKTLWQNGFYKRRDLGRGYYFDADYFNRHHQALRNVVSNVPSVYLNRRRDGTSVAVGKAGIRPCAMSVFVDGNIIPWASLVGIDDIVNQDDILALEVYPRAMDIPTRYFGIAGQTSLGGGMSAMVNGVQQQIGGAFAECGAIFIWTKPFRK